MAADSQILAKLHDIHLPMPVGWWPLAPGWYLLIGLVLVSISLVSYLLFCAYAKGRAKRQALHLLKIYQQEYQRRSNSQETSMKVSELLRRMALIYFPREQVASLQGEAWLAFLTRTTKNSDFTSMRNYFLELPYQPNQAIDLQPLFNGAEAWLKQRRAPCLN